MNYNPVETLMPLLPTPRGGEPVVVAQLGQSLDGRIATVTGASKYINGHSALDHLHRLRAHVDAVVVGVGTAIADDPQLTVRRVDGQSPARVIIDPNGRTPRNLQMLHDGEAPVFVITQPGVAVPEGTLPIHVAGCDGHLPPRDIVHALSEHGMRRILLEGGADTLARFLDADAVDLLHLLMAPMILGSGKAGLKLKPIDQLKEARRPTTRVHVFEDGDVLFTCDLRTSWER